MSFYESFQHPSMEYRGKPFWAWNGELHPEEIRRQMRIFKQMGMGGAFMHSRIGLATEYLGKKWFDAIRAAVDEACQEGLEAWLYDEDCWPSGYAGGRVTENPEHRMRFLVMEILPAKGFKYEQESAFPVWEADVEGDRADNLRWLHPGERPTASHVLVFHEETQPCTHYYNGFTYLDVLSEKAVRAFIDETHEKYRHEIGDSFGNVVPGIFTDEPNFCAFYGEQVPQGRKGIPYSYVPWTTQLDIAFETMHAYSLRSRLPELMLDVDGATFSKVRLDYRNCVTHLFTTNFFKQIYDWCERHQLKLTGHVLLEDSLHLQTLVVGAAMRAYEYMQVPGIDLLTQFARDYDTPKQCQSMAHQMGRPFVLSELYGCTGWDFTFEGHKAVGDWQAALGVNLRCHHLSWYTMKGEAKRDYPASIFFQSPWWEHYRHVEDYFSRLNVALTQGRCEQPILVVHPVESMFGLFKPRILDHDDKQKFMLFPVTDAVQACNESLVNVRNMLLQNHYDFAYGDEDVLSRHGTVQEDGNETRIRVGQCDYEVALVPPMLTMRRDTLTLLAAFRERGGLLVFVGDPPMYVDGELSDAPRLLAEQCPCAPMCGDVLREMLEVGGRRVSVRNAEGVEIPHVLYQHRVDGNRHILFLCNTERALSVETAEVRIKTHNKVFEYDPLTGERSLLPSKRSGNFTAFTTSLAPSGSRLFVIEPGPGGRVPRKPVLATTRRRSLKELDAAVCTEANVCVLDRAAWCLGDKGRFNMTGEILRIDAAVRSAMKLPLRGGEMMQPWARVAEADARRQLLSLQFSFQVTTVIDGPLHLALEMPRRRVISLNGHDINMDAESGWWVDPAIRMIPLDPANLVVGNNVIECVLDYGPDDELEAMYLVGNFGVTLNKGLPALAPRRPLALGDWREQQLPFYGGAVAYRYETRLSLKPGERVFLEVTHFAGVTVRVLVDGVHAGYLSWPPYSLDITDVAKEGKTAITLEVFGSRRNCFGPLHQKNATPPAVGPGNFTTLDDDWTDDYTLQPSGLLAPPVLHFRKEEK